MYEGINNSVFISLPENLSDLNTIFVILKTVKGCSVENVKNILASLRCPTLTAVKTVTKLLMACSGTLPFSLFP